MNDISMAEQDIPLEEVLLEEGAASIEELLEKYGISELSDAQPLNISTPIF